ncbi:hypothetical protein LCGC14_3092900, partial [marine sediment metagenome]
VDNWKLRIKNCIIMFFPYYGFSFLAVIFIIVGVLALLTNLGILAASIWNWWPILLVIFGIYIFVLKKKKKKIIAGHLFNKITSDPRIHDKLKKIIDEKKFEKYIYKELTNQEIEIKDEKEKKYILQTILKNDKKVRYSETKIKEQEEEFLENNLKFLTEK